MNRGLKYAPKPLRHQYRSLNKGHRKPPTCQMRIYPMWVKWSWSKKFIYSSAYQTKAFEPTNSAIPSLYRSRCAGISRQLHPLKGKDLMKDKVVKFDWQIDMCGFAKQSTALELANSSVPLVMPVGRSRVCWNWSSTTSLEDEWSDKGYSNQNQLEEVCEG